MRNKMKNQKTHTKLLYLNSVKPVTDRKVECKINKYQRTFVNNINTVKKSVGIYSREKRVLSESTYASVM